MLSRYAQPLAYSSHVLLNQRSLHPNPAHVQDCVDLLEARPPAGVGVLSLLDEECLFPQVPLRVRAWGPPELGHAHPCSY